MATIDADYLTITAVIGATIGDTEADPDKNPDWVTATAGTVTLTPTVDAVNVTDSTGKTVRMVPFPIVCTIDAQGRLTYNGDPSVTLVDLGSSKVNPSIPRDKAAYNVAFNGVKMDGAEVRNIKTFGINPSPDDVGGDGTINLWDIAPLATGSGGAAIVRGQGVPPVTTAAAGDVIVYDGTDIKWLKQGSAAALDAGVAGGVAQLDGDGVVPVGQVPDLSGTYLPIRVAQRSVRIDAVIFGTSLEALCGSGADVVDPVDASTAQSSRGWVDWLNAYTGQRLHIVANAGVGGDTYAQMRARLDTDVLARQSDWVLMGGPVNDVSQDRIADDIIGDCDAMLGALTEAGRRILLLTAAPSQSYNTPTRKATLDNVNAHIRSLHGMRGGSVLVCDVWPLLADPVTYAPLVGAESGTVDGVPRSEMAVDLVHYTTQAAHLIGRKAAEILTAWIPASTGDALGIDGRRDVIGNPAFRDDGAGWTENGLSGGALSASYFLGAASLDITGVTASNQTGISYLENISEGRLAPGDIIRASARIRWRNIESLSDEIATSRNMPLLQMSFRDADGTFSSIVYSLFTASRWLRISTMYPDDGEVVLTTTAATIGPDVDRVYVQIGYNGLKDGLVMIDELHVWKVN